MNLNGRNVTLAEINKIYGAHQKKMNEDRSILLAAKCRPTILVSRNIKCMQIFAGVPSGRGVKCNKCKWLVEMRVTYLYYRHMSLRAASHTVICCVQNQHPIIR